LEDSLETVSRGDNQVIVFIFDENLELKDEIRILKNALSDILQKSRFGDTTTLSDQKTFLEAVIDPSKFVPPGNGNGSGSEKITRKEEIISSMKKNGYYRNVVARELGVTAGNLYAAIKRYKIMPPDGLWPQGKRIRRERV
jgi:transcriptional regulator with GAF, ATPase, and Fis domain